MDFGNGQKMLFCEQLKDMFFVYVCSHNASSLHNKLRREKSKVPDNAGK
jgi:amino acid permease